MRVGSDALKLPGSSTLPASDQVEQAASHGLEGLFFRSMFHMSPSLDIGELRDIRAGTDDYGMYLESGLGKVNPFALAETPEIRAAGDGDTILGFRRIMEAAAQIGITELWAATGSYKPYDGRFAYDRYRTDALWADQLASIEKLLKTLAPIARELGIHINLETHEEITSFELVRLVEEVGPDTIGITYDTANPLQRAEHPAETVRRVAPYVRQTHIKDAVLFFDRKGLKYQMRPNGQGVVDLQWILPILARENPSLNLSLEVREVREDDPLITAERVGIALYDPSWIEGHPDLTVPELSRYLSLVQESEDRVARGEIPGFEDYMALPFGESDCWQWVAASVEHIRGLLADVAEPAEYGHR